MSKILEGLAVVAEVTGAELSKPALQVMERELSAYHEQAVLRALQRCMRELKHRMTLADVVERLQEGDGRPSADEAWAMALAGMDENATVTLNEDIAEAMQIAHPIYEDGDKVGARMAFRAAYERIVEKARGEGKTVKWWASIGHDAQMREAGLRDGIERGLLPSDTASALLPAPMQKGGEMLLKALGSPNDQVREKLKALREELSRRTR